MLNFYDIAYALGVAVAAPVWAARKSSREKVLRAFGMRMGHVTVREGSNPAILIHAVSLGEINATSQLVAQLHAARPDLHVVISTTTVTGYDRGRQLYAGKPGVSLVRFPLDFSTAINHLLDAVRPSAVVLMEGEIWPNFLLQCEQRKIPVLLVNGRITLPAFQRYRWIAPITAGMLRRVAVLCAQDEVYADRFRQLGAPADRVSITGTMKFDTAHLADRVAGDAQLAMELGLTEPEKSEPGRVDPVRSPHHTEARADASRLFGSSPIWVCGSTGPGEESIILDAYRILLRQFTTLRLVIVPRKPERFSDVAKLIMASGFSVMRRSTHKIESQTKSPGNIVILGDTMGELRKFYSLADVVFVGRTLIDLGPRQHGSDMIEPAALAKPVLIGPWSHNFAETVRMFLAAGAMREVSTISQLTETIAEWLTDQAAARATGLLAQSKVRENQGATARHVNAILRFIPAAVL
jgi:3-deoxy-D-manno-octulosonic-acid transferase